jgi:hypothetical protein
LVGKLTNTDNYRFDFEYISDPLGEEIEFEKVQYLPLKFRKYTWYGLPEAFDEMIIRPDRKDLPKVMKMLGMEKYDPWEFIKRTHGLSMTNYWSFSEDSDGKRICMINTDYMEK